MPTTVPITLPTTVPITLPITLPEQEYYARCAGGFEPYLALELKQLGLKRVRALTGGVAFFASLEQAYRACLWSRIATRILLVLARVDATNANTLYQGAQTVDWAAHIGPEASISVHAQGVNEELRNTQFSAVRVKDALCDQLRELRNTRPSVSNIRPDIVIDVRIRSQKATISLDLSGESLHRRGYRAPGEQGEAPLKETLAAGMLFAAEWPKLAKQGGSLVDPMCGSGTLVIEASLMATDKAPGLLRDYWGFSGWAQHDESIWLEVLKKARARADKGSSWTGTLLGCDLDQRALTLATDTASRAGLSEYVQFYQADAGTFGELLKKQDPQARAGLVAVNPPYGERLASESELPAIYARLSEGLETLGEGWSLAVITPDESIDAFLGLSAFEQIEVYNGSIEVAIRRYEIKPAERHMLAITSLAGHEKRIAVVEKNSDQFAARLRKVAKERIRWAKKQHIACYRLYDADLPDYSAAIDLYEGAGTFEGERWLHIAEYKAPAEIDTSKASRRLNDICTVAQELLDLEDDHVFLKTRKREKGGTQYHQVTREPFCVLTQESGFKIQVDLRGYLDTGIFLDHRLTREMVGSMAADKRFLNLFAYTGVATLHAAGGGAATAKTVDLSNTYLSWAQRNMQLNSFCGAQHQFVQKDVLGWIQEEAASSNRYDLIFVDPPTFSNSKSMDSESWLVQRDHVDLLVSVSKLLAPEGAGVFSCNLRSFKPDVEALKEQGIALEDITAQTIPEDFKRTPKIHHCYQFGRL